MHGGRLPESFKNATEKWAGEGGLSPRKSSRRAGPGLSFRFEGHTKGKGYLRVCLEAAEKGDKKLTAGYHPDGPRYVVGGDCNIVEKNQPFPPGSTGQDDQRQQKTGLPSPGNPAVSVFIALRPVAFRPGLAAGLALFGGLYIHKN
jgi:hypothetical protein